MKFAYLLAPLLITTAAPAFAQAAIEEPALCTDRPTKSTASCTVPQGKVQIETDLSNWTITSGPGSRTDTILITNPTIKYGLGSNTDIELNWAPYVHVRQRAGNVVTNQGGVGDVTVRLKQRFTDGSGMVEVAAVPFIKAPTARVGIGNGEWEGGVVLPVNISLPQGWSLALVPEGDILANVNDPGARHAQFQGVVNVGKTLSSTVTVYGELWTAQNFDPSGTVRQYSADTGIAWVVKPMLQLDLGANFGLNSATPDAQIYAGVSTRF